MRWVVMAGWSLAIACGPAIPLDGDDTTTSTSGDGDETTATMPMPTTAPTPSDESTGAAESSTSTETSISTEATSTVDDDGSAFVFPNPDGGDGGCLTVCIVCDVWAQDCPKGEKCMPRDVGQSMVWDDYICSDVVDEPAAPGDPCFVEGDQWSGIDDCQLSAMCWDTDPETNAGTCVGFCQGSEANPVCEDGTTCFSAYDGWIILCLPPCDPLSPACAAGHACVKSDFDAHGFACIPEILVLDRTAYADACDDNVGCGSGLVCVEAGHVPGCDTEKCCSLLCDPLADNGCPELFRGQYCVPLEGQAELGHCGF